MADQNAASQPGAFQTAPGAPIQNSNAPTVPIMAPDNSIRWVPQQLAQQAISAGGKPVSKVINPNGTDVHWIPHDQLDTARSAGGTVVNPDGSFLVTPMEGEDFAATMQRAAAVGKTVSPDLIKSETSKGMRQAPATLATAYGIGAAMPAAEAAAGSVGPAASTALGTGLKYGKQAADALGAMAEAHPIAAGIIKNAVGTALGSALGAKALSKATWLKDLLLKQTP